MADSIGCSLYFQLIFWLKTIVVARFKRIFAATSSKNPLNTEGGVFEVKNHSHSILKFLKMKNISLLAPALCLVAATIFFACGKDDAASPTRGRVRFFHAVADAPAVDIQIDNASINLRSTAQTDSLAYGAGYPAAGDSSYLSVEPGKRNVKINLARSASTNVLTADLDIVAGNTYTVFAADSAAKVGALVIQEQFTAPKARTSYVRFVHLSPNAPAVTLLARFFRTTNGVRVFSDSVTLAASNAYRTFSTYGELRTDSCDIEVRAVGSTTTVASLQRQRLVEGRHYSIVARGFVGRAAPQNLALTSIIYGR
jgi:hypothetical protein